MRTTVRLDDDLLRQAKTLAARTSRTLTAVIEDGLREALARHRRRQERSPVTLPTFKGKGLRPGVDLDDTAGLLDILDGGRDPS
jgi:type IV secretory pathway VirD2 relaxase